MNTNTKTKTQPSLKYTVSIISLTKVRFKRTCAWCEEKRGDNIYVEKIYSNSSFLTRKRYICTSCANNKLGARLLIDKIDKIDKRGKK